MKTQKGQNISSESIERLPIQPSFQDEIKTRQADPVQKPAYPKYEGEDQRPEGQPSGRQGGSSISRILQAKSPHLTPGGRQILAHNHTSGLPGHMEQRQKSSTFDSKDAKSRPPMAAPKKEKLSPEVGSVEQARAPRKENFESLNKNTTEHQQVPYPKSRRSYQQHSPKHGGYSGAIDLEGSGRDFPQTYLAFKKHHQLENQSHSNLTNVGMQALGGAKNKLQIQNQHLSSNQPVKPQNEMGEQQQAMTTPKVGQKKVGIAQSTAGAVMGGQESLGQSFPMFSKKQGEAGEASQLQMSTHFNESLKQFQKKKRVEKRHFQQPTTSESQTSLNQIQRLRRAPPPFYNAATFVSSGAHGIDETKKSHDQGPETPNIDSSKKSPSAFQGGLRNSSVFSTNKTRKLHLPTSLPQNEASFSRSKQKEQEPEQSKSRGMEKDHLAVPLASQKSDGPLKASLPPQNPLLGQNGKNVLLQQQMRPKDQNKNSPSHQDSQQKFQSSAPSNYLAERGQAMTHTIESKRESSYQPNSSRQMKTVFNYNQQQNRKQGGEGAQSFLSPLMVFNKLAEEEKKTAPSTVLQAPQKAEQLILKTQTRALEQLRDKEHSKKSGSPLKKSLVSTIKSRQTANKSNFSGRETLSQMSEKAREPPLQPLQHSLTGNRSILHGHQNSSAKKRTPYLGSLNNTDEKQKKHILRNINSLNLDSKGGDHDGPHKISTSILHSNRKADADDTPFHSGSFHKKSMGHPPGALTTQKNFRKYKHTRTDRNDEHNDMKNLLQPLSQGGTEFQMSSSLQPKIQGQPIYKRFPNQQASNETSWNLPSMTKKSSDKNSTGLPNSANPLNNQSFAGSYPTTEWVNNLSETANSSLSKHLKENPLSSQFHGKRKHSHYSNKHYANVESMVSNYRERGQNKAWDIEFNSQKKDSKENIADDIEKETVLKLMASDRVKYRKGTVKGIFAQNSSNAKLQGQNSQSSQNNQSSKVKLKLLNLNTSKGMKDLPHVPEPKAGRAARLQTLSPSKQQHVVIGAHQRVSIRTNVDPTSNSSGNSAIPRRQTANKPSLKVQVSQPKSAQRNLKLEQKHQDILLPTTKKDKRLKNAHIQVLASQRQGGEMSSENPSLIVTGYPQVPQPKADEVSQEFRGNSQRITEMDHEYSKKLEGSDFHQSDRELSHPKDIVIPNPTAKAFHNFDDFFDQDSKKNFEEYFKDQASHHSKEYLGKKGSGLDASSQMRSCFELHPVVHEKFLPSGSRSNVSKSLDRKSIKRAPQPINKITGVRGGQTSHAKRKNHNHFSNCLSGAQTSNKNPKLGSGKSNVVSNLVSSETQSMFNKVILHSKEIKSKLTTLKSIGIGSESNSLFQQVVEQIKTIAQKEYNFSLGHQEIVNCIKAGSFGSGMHSQIDFLNYNASFKVNQSVQDTGGKIRYLEGEQFGHTMKIKRDRSINFIINLSSQHKSNPEGYANNSQGVHRIHDRFSGPSCFKKCRSLMSFPHNYTERRNPGTDEQPPVVFVENEDIPSANPSSLQKLSSIKDVAFVKPVGSLMVPASTQSRKNILQLNKNRYQSRQEKASEVEIRQSALSEDRTNSHFFKQLSTEQKLLLRDDMGPKTTPQGYNQSDLNRDIQLHAYHDNIQAPSAFNPGPIEEEDLQGNTDNRIIFERKRNQQSEAALSQKNFSGEDKDGCKTSHYKASHEKESFCSLRILGSKESIQPSFVRQATDKRAPYGTQTGKKSKQSSEMIVQDFSATSKSQYSAKYGKRKQVMIGEQMFSRTEDSPQQATPVEYGNIIKWRENEIIGLGSSSIVYSALRVDNNTNIAVKKFKVVSDISGIDQQKLKIIKNEIEKYKQLENDHIVKYFGCELLDQFFCIYLEQMETSLANTLSEFGSFDEKTIRFYAQQIVEGLAYLHARKIKHLDLKCSNILTNQGNIIKLCDFGSSRDFKKSSGTQSMASFTSLNSQIVGSVQWMAPEVLEEKGTGSKSDVWSLGCTLVEMFNGGNPWGDRFDDQNLFQAHQIIVRSDLLPEPNQEVSDECRDFLRRCLTREYQARPSAQELLSHPWLLQQQ